MQRSHVLGMICGYFLSRFDRRAYERLGYPNQQAAHDALGAALDVPPESIKNWRDRGQLPLYRVRVLEVAGEDYELRDAGQYRAVITLH